MGGETATKERGERAQFAPGSGAETLPVPHLPQAARGRAGVGRWRSALAGLGAAFGAAMAAEQARGGAFLWLPVLLGGGALIYFTLPAEPPAYALVSGLTFLALALAAAGAHFRLRLALTAALVVLLGIAAAKLETRRADTLLVGSDVTTRVIGRLVALEHRADGRYRLTIALTGTERPELHYPPERVRLTARDIPFGLAAGDGVRGLARLMSPSGPVRPGGYDFSFQSYFDGLGAVGFFMRDPQRADLGAASPSMRARAWLQRLREGLAARIGARIDGPEGAIATALITGLRAGIPEPVSEALRRAGLAHVLAISGLHMALVAFTVIGIARLGFAFFPGFSSRHPVRKYAAAAALLVCLLYLFVSGAAVAAQRSFLMLAVMLGALMADRAALTMRNLAIAALVILALAPHEVVGPGFQMSFAATAALIAGYAAWNGWRARRLDRGAAPPASSPSRKALRLAVLYIGGLALTSLIAGTATALYGAWHFQRASPLALGANLAAMPLVSLVVMPMAVAAVAAMPFNLDWLPLAVMGEGVAAVIAVARWFSARTPVDATGLVPLASVIVLTLALLLLTLSATRLRYLSLPLLCAGLLLLAGRQLPDALVAEDARLVGMRMSDGRLAVNRSRPNGFVGDNWLRAVASDTFAKPRETEGGALSALARVSGETGFLCGAAACLARHESGAVIAHVEKPDDPDAGTDPILLKRLCAAAALLVVNDATVDDPCAPRQARFVTGRDLARRGSAEIRFARAASGTNRARAAFAIALPWRPWHDHRQYSRAARGLPEYR